MRKKGKKMKEKREENLMKKKFKLKERWRKNERKGRKIKEKREKKIKGNEKRKKMK